MILNTDRLLIRHFKIEDAPELFKMDTDPLVMKFIGQELPKSIDESIASIERQIKYYKEHPHMGIFPAFTKESNQFVGWTALKYLSNTKKIEIGYRLNVRFWGHGYATELANSMIYLGTKFLNCKEFYAVTHLDNIASQKVLKKVGFNEIGLNEYYNTIVKEFKLCK